MFKELKRIFKDTVVYGLGSLLPKLAGIVLVPIYTRYLTPSDYGIISLATMITTMVSNVMLFGQQGSLTLLLRQIENEDRRDEAKALVFSSVTFVMVVGAVLLSVLLAIGPTVTPVVVDQPAFTFDPFMRIALLTAFLTLPFGLIQAVNRSRGQAKTHTFMQLSSFVLNTAVTIYLVVALKEGAFGSLKGNFAAALLLAPVALLLLARNMRLRFSREWLQKSLAFGLPLVPHYFAGWMLTFSDRWIIGQFRSLEEVGLYSLAYNLSMVLNMAVMAINTAWGPIYYDLAATEDGRAKLPRLITVYASAVTALAITYLLFSREALYLLATPRYYEAAGLVPVIVAAYFAFALYAVMSTGIFYARKTKLVPLISAAAAAVSIGLNLLLVPRYGMWAAAWVNVAAYSVMALAARYLSGKLAPGTFEDARLLRLVAIFGVTFGADLGIDALGLSVWAALAVKAALLVLAVSSFVWLDIISVSEVKALVDRLAARRKGGGRGGRVASVEDEMAAADDLRLEDPAPGAGGA